MTEKFLQAVEHKKKIRLKFYSKEDGYILTRLCAPMDYGPSRRAKNKENRFHFWDYESDSTNHVLSLLKDQIVEMEFTDSSFEPSEFITWPTDWFIERDWGHYS